MISFESNYEIPLLTICGTLISGYLSTFVSENFKRRRDGNALAAALVGELSAHAPHLNTLKDVLNQFMKCSDHKLLLLRPIPIPVDAVYDSSVSKLGLLGCELAEDVVFVYQSIRGFRLSMDILSRNFKEMERDEFLARCRSCIDSLDRAATRGEPLIPKLKKFAHY